MYDFELALVNLSAMQFTKFNERIDYLKELIRKEATGTPQQLASRLHISKRMVYRCINEIHESERPVAYSRVKQTYKFL